MGLQRTRTFQIRKVPRTHGESLCEALAYHLVFCGRHGRYEEREGERGGGGEGHVEGRIRVKREE